MHVREDFFLHSLHTRWHPWYLPLCFYYTKQNTVCETNLHTGRQTDVKPFFSVLPQISGNMNLGMRCVCRPVCWPFGRLLDSRHCVFALTLLTLLMQVVVEANSWWYAFLLSPYVQHVCVCMCVFIVHVDCQLPFTTLRWVTFLNSGA